MKNCGPHGTNLTDRKDHVNTFKEGSSGSATYQLLNISVIYTVKWIRESSLKCILHDYIQKEP